MDYRVKVTGIEWDIDDDDLEESGLVEEYEFEVSGKYLEDRYGKLDDNGFNDNDEDIEDIMSSFVENLLSDRFDYTHKGFEDIKIKEFVNLGIEDFVIKTEENNVNLMFLTR